MIFILHSVAQLEGGVRRVEKHTPTSLLPSWKKCPSIHPKKNLDKLLKINVSFNNLKNDKNDGQNK